MDVLMLCYRDEPLREFPIGSRPLEIGRGAGCDIVVHDPAVDERHLLVRAHGGTVLVHDLLAGARAPGRTLPPNEPLPLGRHHSLVRVPDAPTRPRRALGGTEPLATEARGGGELSLVVGRGGDARRVPLERQPLTVGTDAACDLVLHDRTISGRHCRFEPADDGLQVRDLGSRNGTFVEGVPVTLARVVPGSKVRIGRTDLRVVPRGRPGDARSLGLVAASTGMQEVLGLVETFARLEWPVLISGESGSGKEGVARALHERGPSPGAPFVAVNAGGLPPSLVESELFGHEKGAFTGAAAQRRGVFEQADGGTLFLDEIGELPLDQQARLLRVLETWQVRRLGSERPVRVRVRLVCATNRDLSQRIADGFFRQDLYYRIAQLGIHVPPLRDRPRDVDALAQHFLVDASETLGPRRFGADALSLLRIHDWPGNARELRNIVRQAAALSAGPRIGADEVRRVLGDLGGVRLGEARRLEGVLAEHGGNFAAAARAIGMPRSTFRDRLRRAREHELRKAG
ncbi:MAG TPA: sigma 54-interacting transcriptional regulator [Sandaracinaceae bacterium LLY-WYZ-13_1]|nr:sigma 54-interacting transcriptional regulator [Sandaracinaceae bacterium LLY-WYZ-13_1]